MSQNASADPTTILAGSAAPSDCEVVARKSADRRPVDDPSVTPRKGRSKVTNGSVLIAGVDQRNRWVRRARDIIAAHLSDLGGADNTSAAERSIIRRAAVLTTELEVLERRFALAGEACSTDLEVYQRCANSLRRLLEAVGLQRRQRVVSSLGELLQQDIEQQRRDARERPLQQAEVEVVSP